MAALIDWGTVGEVFAESLAAVLVVVAAVAAGARLLAGTGNDRRLVSWFAPAACFAIAFAAVGYGVFFTIDK